MVRCRDGVVEDVRPESEEKEGKDEGDAKVIDARGGILVPSYVNIELKARLLK